MRRRKSNIEISLKMKREASLAAIYAHVTAKTLMRAPFILNISYAPNNVRRGKRKSSSEYLRAFDLKVFSMAHEKTLYDDKKINLLELGIALHRGVKITKIIFIQYQKGGGRKSCMSLCDLI
jgi:hypothetical protein